MPVQKFRNLEEMQRASYQTPVPDAARQLARVLEFWHRAMPRQVPRGVWRFRSIDEANQAREEWIDEQVRVAARRKLERIQE